MAKISKREANQIHAAVDEIIATLPEAATALATLLTTLTGAAGAVSVSAKKGGKGKGKVSPTNDDIDDIDDEDDDIAEDDEDGEDGEDEDADADDEDDDVEDLDDVKPRGKGKASKKAAEAPELEDLELDSIMEFFNNVEVEETHERVAEITAIKELEAAVESFGFDAASVLDGATKLADKRARFHAFLSDVHTTIDAITEFEVDSVVEAINETDEAFVAKGRGKTKEINAASKLFQLAVENDE